MTWLRPERRSVTLESILGPGGANAAGVSWSGIPVTPRSALGHPAVYRCRQLICGKLSDFPWTAFQRKGRAVQEMPTQPVLLTRPSGVVNLRTWKWQAVESVLFDGNAVGRIVRTDDRQYPVQIELVPMEHVAVRRVNGEWRWLIEGKEVDRDAIWHVAFDPPPGHILGRSLLEHAANAIGTGIASGRYSAQFYGDGGNPTMVMRNTKKAMSRGDINEVKEAVAAVLRARREPLVIGSDWEVKPWQVSPAEAQLIQVWARNTTDVANYFGVPAEYLGGSGTPMTYSNLGARRQDLVALCLSVWGGPIEAGLTDCLPKPQYVRIGYEDFVRGDMATVAAIDERDLRAGVKSQNEVRLTRGLPPVEGGDVLNWPPGSTAEEPAPAPAPPTPAPAPTED